MHALKNLLCGALPAACSAAVCAAPASPPARELSRRRCAGSFIPKCNVMNPLRPYIPCESACHDYTAACGQPRELLCSVFGDPDDPEPGTGGAAPFAMCKGTSSFPRFMHREWLSLMPGLDPADKDLAMAELKLAMELEPAAHPADAEEVYAQLLEQQGPGAPMPRKGGGGKAEL